MSTDDDQLVEDYLRELHIVAQGLPADRRDELVEEITAHIAEARQSDGSPLAVRNILDRLGDPADIVRAAADTPPGSQAWSGASSSAGHPAGQPATQPGRAGALELAAVLFLLLGGIVIPVLGWFIGVVLLWMSPRWTAKDKLLGTLVWPGGLLAPALLVVAGAAAGLLATSVTTCVGGPVAQVVAPVGAAQQNVHQAATHCTTSGGIGLPPWLVITLGLILLILAVAGPIWTASRLLRRARQSPAEPVSAPANLIPA
jgi:uncharacterized membrane protein